LAEQEGEVREREINYAAKGKETKNEKRKQREKEKKGKKHMQSLVPMFNARVYFLVFVGMAVPGFCVFIYKKSNCERNGTTGRFWRTAAAMAEGKSERTDEWNEKRGSE
jgi:hypothetical protein